MGSVLSFVNLFKMPYKALVFVNIKFLLVFIAICCAPVLFVLLIVFFALLMAATGLIAALPAVLYEAGAD